ncbi:MAG: TrkH family potassium uptake protein [Tissierellia bacterium]|nr:TrkH family potassium uptake protein [Tissierellia bacterium]
MNYVVSIRVIGSLLYMEAALLVAPFLISIYDGSSDRRAFFWTIILAIALGRVMRLRKGQHQNLRPKDGLLIVSLGWIIVSIVGAIPFWLSGSVPTYIDGLFEAVSGFTTTGASIIKNIEILPRGVVFWRSLTHWIGGMGILVFALSLLPALGAGAFQIFKAETPGPIAGKIAPRMKDTAKILYITYFVVTLLLFILLIIGGMDWFDGLVHTFGVVGTGGFSSKVTSVGHYNSVYIEVVMTIFMVVCGVNFSHYYNAYRERSLRTFKDEEFRLFIGIIIISIILVSANLRIYGGMTLPEALRSASFTNVSIISTSGFATVDYDMWPAFSRLVILILMFMGSSAGSTAGGMKMVRILIMAKAVRREIARIFHSKAVMPIKFNGKVLNDGVVSGITAFLSIYAMVFAVSVLVISFSGYDMITSISSAATTMSNVGPGLSLIGPTSNFAFFPQWIKLYLSLLMLMGRLEFFTLIALIAPKRWEREGL